MQVKKNKLRAERCNSLSHVRSTTTRSAKSLRKGKNKKIRRKCATVARYLASSSLRSSLASTSSFPLSIFDGEGARGQCHLNKKNVPEALLFEGKTLLSRSLAMERGIGTLDDARVKAEAAWRQQRGRFPQIRQESRLHPGELLPRDQGKLVTGGVQHLNGMREAEAIGVQIGLTGG